MIKHILTLAVLFPAFAASADVLLWQVTTAEATRYTSSSGGTADYAVFYYADTSGNGVGVRLDDAVLFTPGYPTTGVAAMPEQNALAALPPGTGDRLLLPLPRLSGRSVCLIVQAIHAPHGL